MMVRTFQCEGCDRTFSTAAGIDIIRCVLCGDSSAHQINKRRCVGGTPPQEHRFLSQYADSPLSADAMVGRAPHSPVVLALPPPVVSIASMLMPPNSVKANLIAICNEAKASQLNVVQWWTWPFFRKKQHGQTSPQAFALNLVERLSKCSDVGVFGPILTVKWLQTVRNSRVCHWYGCLPIGILFQILTGFVRAPQRNRLGKGEFTDVEITNYVDVCAGQCTFLELIPQNTTVRLHFDIDDYVDAIPTMQEQVAFLEQLICLVESTLSVLQFEPVMTASSLFDRITVTTDHRQVEDRASPFKASYHVIFTDLFVTNNHTVMHAFYQRLIANSRSTGVLWNVDSGSVRFDTKIATKNRVLRLLMCSGVPSDSNKRPTQLKGFFFDRGGVEVDGQRRRDLVPFSPAALGALGLFERFLVHYPSVVSEFVISPALFPVVQPPASIQIAPVVQSVSVGDDVAPVSVAYTQTTYTKLEWEYIYAQFVKFLSIRKKIFRTTVDSTVVLDSISCMRALANNPMVVYITCMNDRFCEYKGRCHHQDNGTKTSYGFSYLRQVCWQTCLACNASLSDGNNVAVFYSVAPGEIQGVTPTLYQTLVDEEWTLSILFREVYHKYLKVVPGAKKTLWAYHETSKLWRNDTDSFMWNTWPAWINRQLVLVSKTVEETQVKKLKEWAKRYTSAGGVDNVRKWVLNAGDDRDFAPNLNKQAHLIPMNDGTVWDLTIGGKRLRVMEDCFSMEMDFRMVDQDENGDDLLAQVEAIMLEYGCFSEDWVRYHQELFGYFMTGYTNDRGFYQQIGVGSNGKGCANAALAKVMGGFYQAASSAFVSATGNSNAAAEGASPTLAMMEYARVCAVSELKPGCKLAMDRMKSWSSGDLIRSRMLYQGSTTWKPGFKILIQSNYHSEMDGADNAALDRFRTSFWGMRYVENPRVGVENERQADSAMGDALAKHLSDAFGTWCVLGAQKMYNVTSNATKRISRPECIQDFITKTLEKADVVSAFIRQEAITTDHDATWLGLDMFDSFVAWARRRQSAMQTVTYDNFLLEIEKRRFEFMEVLVDDEGRKKFKGVKRRVVVYDDDVE